MCAHVTEGMHIMFNFDSDIPEGTQVIGPHDSNKIKYILMLI